MRLFEVAMDSSYSLPTVISAGVVYNEITVAF
ncbi:UNVERIFIED_ORG: hypothetical protein J2W65_002817 [Pseudomonas parafulva]|nr:hypothetical protein [Pseudomonas parafulva]